MHLLLHTSIFFLTSLCFLSCSKSLQTENNHNGYSIENKSHISMNSRQNILKKIDSERNDRKRNHHVFAMTGTRKRSIQRTMLVGNHQRQHTFVYSVKEQLHYIKRHHMDCYRLRIPEYIGCYTCIELAFDYLENNSNKTLCFVRRTSDEITFLLHQLSVYGVQKVVNLLLVVDNTYDAFLAIRTEAINITSIQLLKYLEKLEIRKWSSDFFQQYALLYEHDTFKYLNYLKVLILSFPIQDQTLEDMLEPLNELVYLELCQVYGMSMNNMTASLSKVNNTSLRFLHLHAFQLIGATGFSGILNITSFFSGRTFKRLESFVMSGNSIYVLLPGIYRVAPNLKNYDLSENILLDLANNAALTEGLWHPSIEIYTIDYQGYIGGMLRDNPKSSSAETNQGEEKGIAMPFRETKKGNIYEDYFSKLAMTACQCINKITNPSNISLFFNNKIYTKQFLNCMQPEPKPDLIPTELYPLVSEIYDFSCTGYIKIPFGRKLSKLHISFAHWEAANSRQYFHSNNTCVLSKSLRELSFSNNAAWLKGEGTLRTANSIKGLETLETIDLSFNNLHINLSELATSNRFPNVITLNFSSNIIHLPEQSSLCIGFRIIKYLNLSITNLTNLPQNLFGGCNQLESIILSHNSLKNLSGLRLNMATNLRELDLSYNLIPFLTKDITNQLELISDANHNITIDLSNNPLDCGCDKEALEFTRWIIQNKHLFKNFDKYYCTRKTKELFLKDLDERYVRKISTECNNTVQIVISVLSTLLCVALLLVTYIAYRKRWKLKYLVYRYKQSLTRLFCCRRKQLQDSNWVYDAFISYCSDDRFWVHGVLMKTLEEDYGFKLCIHYRDFPVGGNIADVIVEKMQQSREIIIVISDISLTREWCKFEMVNAIRQSQIRNQSVMVIKMGSLSDESIADNASVAYILDMHTYLEWNDHPSGQKLFWAKLVGKLYEDGDGNQCCTCLCPYGARYLSYEQIN